MSGPFASKRGSITFKLDPAALAVLRAVPTILDTGGDADGRLSYKVHPNDPAADERYQELVADSLEGLRRQDRSGFDLVVSGSAASPEDVEAFMRVIGEARIVLAARLGIEDDGWEADLVHRPDPELALLGWLGYLQDEAVGVLSKLL